MRSTIFSTSLVLALLLGGCDGAQPADDGPADDGPGAGGSGGSDPAGGAGGAPAPAAADTLFRYLTGRFDSSAQAATSPSYYPVQLEICEVAAPEIGARVLYVEQAMMTSLDAPYRQRLYLVEPGADPASQAHSRVFELVDPAAAVHLCSGEAVATVAAVDAIERAGCRVDLQWDGTQLVGGTAGDECASSLNGASYATSEVTVREDGIDSWDRGFDAEGNQVWGATAGPYQFLRQTPLPE